MHINIVSVYRQYGGKIETNFRHWKELIQEDQQINIPYLIPSIISSVDHLSGFFSRGMLEMKRIERKKNNL